MMIMNKANIPARLTLTRHPTMVKMGLRLHGAGPGSGEKRRQIKIFRPTRLQVLYRGIGQRHKFGNVVRALMAFGLPIAMKLINKYL